MPREVRRVRDMDMRLVDRVGPGPQHRHDPQRNSLTAVVISEHPLMWAPATGDRSNVVL